MERYKKTVSATSRQQWGKELILLLVVHATQTSSYVSQPKTPDTHWPPQKEITVLDGTHRLDEIVALQ